MKTIISYKDFKSLNKEKWQKLPLSIREQLIDCADKKNMTTLLTQFLIWECK